jgi:tetratricopeptide (TPR) repeat protein
MRAGRRVLTAAVIVMVALTAGCATMSLVETIESLLAQVKELLVAKKYDEALSKLTEVIRRDPTQWKAYLYSAQAYIGKSDWGQSLTSARKALELAPRETEALTTLVQSLWGAGVDALKRGSFRDAAGHFVEYIRLRPTDAQGYLHAGRAYLGTGSWGDALSVLTSGLGQAGDPATRAQLGQTLLEGGRQALSRGEYRGAVGLLSQYVRVDQSSVSAWLDLGKAAWSAGDRSDALTAFRRVLELAPGNEEARRFILGR